MRRILGHQDDRDGKHSDVLVLLDLRKSKGLDKEARRLGAEWGNAHAKRFAVAMWGANVIARALGPLLHSAIGMLSGQRPRQAFFDTESEPRSWLETQRSAFQTATEQ